MLLIIVICRCFDIFIFGLVFYISKLTILKILIIRFGAIGDIIMTTPIIRCVKQQLEAELHYITASKYSSLLEGNIHLDKIHLFENNWTEIRDDLKAEDFNLVIDLHKVTKSVRLGSFLKKPVIQFKKATLAKWLELKFRINRLPKGHLIDRFFEGVDQIKVTNDGKGMELVVDKDSERNALKIIDRLGINNAYTALVIGGAKWTKQVPIELCVDYIKQSEEPIVLIGGPDESDKAKKIVEFSNRHINNFVGLYTLLESAVFLRQSKLVITGDTGMMHMAAVFSKPTIVMYGSTSPIFGMYPYVEGDDSHIKYLIPDHLSCWPCSKSGRTKCPKIHAKCLYDWKAFDILSQINKLTIRN